MAKRTNYAQQNKQRNQLLSGYKVLLGYSKGARRQEYLRAIRDIEAPASVKKVKSKGTGVSASGTQKGLKSDKRATRGKKKVASREKKKGGEKVVSRLKASVRKAEASALNDTIKGYRTLYRYSEGSKRKAYGRKITELVNQVKALGEEPSVIQYLDVRAPKHSDALNELPTAVDKSDKDELRRLRNNANARLRRKKKKIAELMEEKGYGWKSKRSALYKDLVVLSRYKNELAKAASGHVKEAPKFVQPEFNVEKGINHYSYMVWQFEEILRTHIEGGHFKKFVFVNSEHTLALSAGEIDILREYDQVRNSSYGMGMSTPIVDVTEDFQNQVITIDVQS